MRSRRGLGLLVALSMPLIGSTQTDVPRSIWPNMLRRSWGTESGLPQSSVTAIAQTPDGYLWLATFGGLARFDGVKFTIFESSNTLGLKSNRLRALYADPSGVLWIGTEHGGLTSLARGVAHTYSHSDGLPSNIVTSLASDGQGGFFVGTTEGIAHFSKGRFQPIETSAPLPRDTINAIHVDRTGTLWLGTESSGLVEIRSRTVRRYNTSPEAFGGRIWAVAGGEAGTLWIGSDQGLSCYRSGTFSRVLTTRHTSLGKVVSLRSAPSGSLWAGASTGLYQIQNGTAVLKDKISKTGDSLVRAVFVDREHSIWIGTDEGLQQWSPTNATSYTGAHNLTDHPVASVFRDSAGAIWIGSLGAGLFRYDGKSFSHIGGSNVDSPASIAEGPRGTLWLGDWNRGLLRLCSNHTVAIPVPGLDVKVIRSEFVDSKGVLWIGTDQRGVYMLSDGVFHNFRKSNGLLSDTVVYIWQDRAGCVWMVSPEGISRFDSGRFTSYTSSDILLARTIQQDPTGALWIGTYGYGLFRFRDGVFRRVTTADGLPEAVVSSMLPDGYDYVWMSGNRGIHRCNWEHLNQVADRIRPQLDCVSLNAADGLITSEANGIGEPAGIVAPDGRLWFATVRGVAVIDPKPLPETKIPLIIEQVSVDGGPVPADSPIVIRPGQKNLQISYTAPTFLRPERVQFRYRFEEGPDSSWSDAGHQRTVTFQGLAPGSYSFHVISDNGFGFWNPVGARLRFRIAAPFWRSGWFLSLASLLLVASGVLVHQLRLRSVKNAHALQQTFSRMLIESQERERQSIAAELHDSLGQSLLVMKNKAFLAAKSLPNPQTAGQQLADISALAADAIDEVRAITFNLHPYRLDRFGLTRSILGMCAQAFESAGIAFKTDVDSIDGVFSKEAERSMFRVVQEAVNNIIKHSGSTNAEVVVKREANRVRISIRDNGRGFVASEVPGRSFGLRGMAERIKMLGGTYSVLSSDGTGTTIHIELKA